MSYANGTTHYNLPLTVGTDKRDWTDTNQAFTDVDSALYTASQSASSSASAITTLQNDINGTGGVAERLTTAEGDITTIEGNITTIHGSITSLRNKIDAVEDDALDMICAVDQGTAQVATVAVSEGDYFRYNNVLYKATTGIAIGDTIVPNTNCTATNVATELENDYSQDIADLNNRVSILESNATFTRLWNNPNINADFEEQTISLDLSGYDAIRILTETGAVCEGFGELNMQSLGGGSGYIFYRNRNVTVNASEVHFSNNTLSGLTGTDTVNNSVNKPVSIIGIKY